MSKLSFQSAEWAEFLSDADALKSLSGEMPIHMSHSDGTALPLLLDSSGEKNFGADIIRFEAGKGVSLHKHVGSHILLVTKGEGILTYQPEEVNERHPMFPGMIYLIPSNVAHSIDATTELVLIAIGNDHRSAETDERLDLVV
jgi:quercetin dioxygenase-like cupin family protein